MNEPAVPPPLEAEAAPPDAAAQTAEPAPADFGTALRAAREAAGISIGTLAGRLRLHVKQIEALERADLAALPTLIYVRGFVRSCARELKIDPAPLLEDLNRRAGVIAGSPAEPEGGNFPFARFGDGSRPLIAIAIVVLVIAGIVGTLWPRRVSPPPPPVAAEPVPALADPSPAAPEPADAASAGSSAVPPGAPPGSPAASSAGGGAGAGAAARGPAGPAAKPGAATAPGGNAPPVANADIPPPVSAPAALAPGAQAAVEADALVLHVHAPSWVEVVQANGTSVFSQICPAGSVQTVRGVAPLRVVIGNAAAVDAQYHGAAVDLNRYANVNGVARFTLQ